MLTPLNSGMVWVLTWKSKVKVLVAQSSPTQWLHFHFSRSCIGEGNGNPLQCSCLENPREKGAWWAAVYGVTQSQTRLKWLSSSSNTGRKWKRTKEPLDEGEGGEWKSWLKTQHSENWDHGIWFYHFMVNRWGNDGNSDSFYFGELQNHCRWWLQPWN